MENDNAISKMLSIFLIFMIIVLFALVIAYIIIVAKNKSKRNDTPKNIIPKNNNKGTKNKTDKKSKSSDLLPKKSIFDFMEFDDVKDNMIIQKNGKRYLAVIECLGVNYDLMSKLEKNAVEEGFQQFLNTLRHPIQIYIQTRTMNLGKSIQNYKERVNAVEERYNKINREYIRMKESGAYSQEDLSKYNFEVTKSKNLLEYGRDIIANTERMSLNKNVLTKKYYIVIPYFPEDIDKYDIEEIRNMAFSELYTKAQSIIATLSACSITGRLLDSQELIELLYMSYNREEAEIYGLDRAIQAQYDSLYSTAPDVFEQKLRILDEQIKEQSQILANSAIEQAKSKAQELSEQKEDNIDDLIRRLASGLVQNNQKKEGKEVTEEALKIIEEGGDENVSKKKQTRRSTNKQ